MGMYPLGQDTALRHASVIWRTPDRYLQAKVDYKNALVVEQMRLEVFTTTRELLMFR